MSSTGTWKWDRDLGRLVQVSRRVPNVSFNDHVCNVPSGGYFSENLGSFVEDRSHKRRLMEARGVREVETGEKFSRKSAAEKSAARRRFFEAALPD
jgi:hypothetical protein